MYEQDRRLKIFLPAGELFNDIEAYLKTAGLIYDFPKNEGDVYFTKVENMPLDLIVMRASSIPIELDDENCGVKTGITGSDILWDAGWGTDSGIELKVKDVVPNAKSSSLFIGINETLLEQTVSPEETDSIIKRLEGGMIATKFTNIAKEYFANRKIQNVKIKYAPGKDEAYQYAYKSLSGILGTWCTGKTALANNIIPIDNFYDVTTRLVQERGNSMEAWEVNLFNDFKESCYIAEQGRQ